jgi:hypothetical protein
MAIMIRRVHRGAIWHVVAADLVVCLVSGCTGVASFQNQRHPRESEAPAPSLSVRAAQSALVPTTAPDAGVPKRLGSPIADNRKALAKQWVAERCKFKPPGDTSREIVEGTGPPGARFVEDLTRAAEPLVGSSEQVLKVLPDGFVISAQGKDVSVKRGTSGGNVIVNGKRFQDEQARVLFSTLHAMLLDITAKGFQFMQLTGGIAQTRRLVPQGGIELVFDSMPNEPHSPERLLRVFMSFMRDYRGPPPEIRYSIEANVGSSYPPRDVPCPAKP